MPQQDTGIEGCEVFGDGLAVFVEHVGSVDTWLQLERGEDLSHLFDRLYRVDGSRNRKQGGSGLGLAICKNIVEAHDGTIRAEHSSLGGLKLVVQFPTM